MQPVIPPKIKVYYVPADIRVLPAIKRPAAQHWHASAPPPHPWKRHFLATALLSIALVFGLGGGLWLGWSSRPGVAEQNPSDTVTEQQNFAGAPIPLQFEQSDLEIVANLLPILIEENRHEPTPEENADAKRKEALRNYLVRMKSPLAKDDGALEALLHARNMKMILAISFVESNICRHEVGYNCSGIGGSQIKKYDSFAGWINDFDSLLEKRYKNLPVEKFIGYYVQPGSQNWIDGVYQILGDLGARHID